MAGALTATVTLLAAPAALAGTASVENGIARYQADNGEDNSVIVSESPHPTNALLKVVTFRDVVQVGAGAGCALDSAFSASCSVPVTSSRVRAGLEDLSDGLQASSSLVSMGFSVEGDGGGDRLVGSAQHDVLDGVDGNDTLLGNDGDDSLEGAGGEDNLYGGSGKDTIYGGPQADRINAGPDDDYVDAGVGDDQVIGGDGGDILYGYFGADTINADDGEGGDYIDCGPGFDRAIFNDGDQVNASNCEILQPA
jgi:Ca2+-binding RTX toxin-like protein